MTLRLDVIASVSDAGKPGRANEDRFGANRSAAFVLDGATGLGDRQFMDSHESDAAWIADYAAQRLSAELEPGTDVADLLRRISTDARTVFDAVAGEQPRYAWPLAALAGLSITEQGLEFFGLGDSVVYVLHDDGRTQTCTALPDAFEREQAAARAHITRLGGIGAAGSLVGDPQTLDDLRASRARQNTPQGRVWSLGLVPDAADHLARRPIPLTGGATAVICSDGLADLVSLYRLYDAGALIRRAATAGLAPLVAELRHMEREVDPEGLQYPRFKQSDDTTAILVRVEG